MTERAWLVLLMVPAPLYVALRFLLGFSLDSLWIPLGFAVTLSFGLASGLGVVRPGWWAWVGVVALVLAVVVPIAPTFPSRMAGLDLGCGVMLGVPFVGLEGAWRSRYSPAIRFGTLELTVFLGVWYLAALPAVASHGGALSGYEFLKALSGVLVGQAQGLFATFTNGGSTAVLPLRSAVDPVFVGLAAFALLGVVITTLEPHTALDEPLPWAWTIPRRSEWGLGASVRPEELREGQKSALDSRSRPMAPETGVPPGVPSLVLAGLAMALVVLGALYLPLYFLSVLMVAVTVLIVAVMWWVSRRSGSTQSTPSAGDGAGPSEPESPPARPA